MKLIMILYNLFLPLALATLKAISLFNKKVARTLNAKKGIRKRWHLMAAGLDRKIPLIWIY